jgi:hypothetical protein
MIGTDQERALDALRYDWGDAYDIGVDEWQARRKDGKGGLIEAATPDQLRRLIIEDYTFLPVPRDLP